MEPEDSLPYTQAPATCPYSKPDQFNPSHFLKIRFNIIPSAPSSSKWSLSLGSPHQNAAHASPVSPIPATCPAHLILIWSPE